MAVNLSAIKDLLLPGLRGVEGQYEQIPSQYDKIFTKHNSNMALERTAEGALKAAVTPAPEDGKANDAVVALLAGEIDAMAMVSAPESPIVRMLLITPGIRLLDFAQAEAYARRVPQVSPVGLPRGVVDLAKDLPAQDVRLVAATAMLVVRDDTHPALQQLLVQIGRAHV